MELFFFCILLPNFCRMTLIKTDVKVDKIIEINYFRQIADQKTILVIARLQHECAKDNKE